MAAESVSQVAPKYHEDQPKSMLLASNVDTATNGLSQLGQRYKQLLLSEKYYDCIFQVADVKVKCHKLILSAASPVFEAMFFGPMREQQQEIEVLDISAEMFRMLVTYIYAGTVDFEQLTLEQVIELYYAGEKYLLSTLIADSLSVIKRKLRFSNILPALELSFCINIKELLDICMSFFGQCCLNNPLYMHYLKSDYFHVSKECIKAIIATSENLQKSLLWFVYEWCQQECKDLGLKPTDCALIMEDLQLKESGATDSANLQFLIPSKIIERTYYKARRPFNICFDGWVFETYIKCDRFISLRGIVLASRLAPIAAAPNIGRIQSCSDLYKENLVIDISAPELDERTTLLCHALENELTPYNCDMNVFWSENVVIIPGVEYVIKLTWPSDTKNAQYPTSMRSLSISGIQFRESVACGSLLKGLRITELI